MEKPTRRWKMYVIHHSHTDIGYTERQEKIEQYHVDFIRQALDIIEEARSGARPEWQGFRWTCEAFWPVERFWEKASEQQRQRFAEALRNGDINLSGTYLNMTELIDYDIIRNLAAKAGAFGGKIAGVRVDSAMTADINGYSWGYSQALADAGIQNLLSCIHTHHGMYAAGRKQFPFYWETPKGDRVLVWSGEHYMLGNDLGLSPGAVLSYTIRDEFNGNAWMENHWELAEHRISRYLRQLEKENYPYDFGLLNVMGLLRDNAAPNGAVAAFIREWNAKHGDWVTFEMTSLSRFFEEVRKQEDAIPVYRGDWPDWWSDGIVSTPAHTMVFREAQRNLRLIKRLDPDSAVVGTDTREQAEFQLAMYAEHTWGYHSSVYEPWHPMVHALAVRKEAYAAGASRMIDTALDEVLRFKGEALLAPDRPFRFKIMNPSDRPLKDMAHLYLEAWEPSLFQGGIEVRDQQGSVLPHQTEWVSRGYQISVPISLEPDAEQILTVGKSAAKPEATTKSSRLKGNDGVYDIEDLINLEGDSTAGVVVSAHYVETPRLRIEWKTGDGIVSWVDKITGKQLLRRDREFGAFTPVYEVTPAEDGKMADVRRRMGRNRKGMNVKRSAGRLTSVKEITNGPLYAVVELLYETEGMSHFSLLMKLYPDRDRVDVGVRMHKNSVWEPENVYIALPFTTGGAQETLWLDKAGALVRPGIDQIPGTGLDFYCIQDGLTYVSEQGGVAVATPDAPLIQTGPLEYGSRKVHGQQKGDEPRHLYAWLMTNYWETNFKATLGGFYEFRYVVQWSEQWKNAEDGIGHCRSVNAGPVCFRTL